MANPDIEVAQEAQPSLNREEAPTTRLEEGHLEYPSDGEVYPAEKSDVGNDKDPLPFPCRHSVGQRVHMMVDDGRALRKQQFLVKDVRPHRRPREPAYWEYQLASKEGAVYLKGKYFREKDVKREW